MYYILGWACIVSKHIVLAARKIKRKLQQEQMRINVYVVIITWNQIQVTLVSFFDFNKDKNVQQVSA